MCAGLGAWLLRMCLCWRVEGHAMLWGDRGLAGVVLCGVCWRWGIFGWDSILRRRRVLGRGVGLGHCFRRSRGVLIALWVEEAKRWLEPLSLPEPSRMLL